MWVSPIYLSSLLRMSDIYNYAGVLPAVQERQARCKFLLYFFSIGVLLTFLQYLKAIWNVINFKEAEQRFITASK